MLRVFICSFCALSSVSSSCRICVRAQTFDNLLTKFGVWLLIVTGSSINILIFLISNIYCSSELSFDHSVDWNVSHTIVTARS